MGRAARAAARVGRAVAHPRRRLARRGDHRRGAAAGADAGDGGRRARAHRPAPRRRAAPRGGHRGAARRDRAGRVAAAAHRRGRAGGRRGAQPPPRVRRGRGPGAHHPPQQGPRVPDRLPPVPVGADLAARGRRADRLPRPRARRRADARRRAGGPEVVGAQAPAPDRGARGGPAAGVRRAHARAPPGGAVVGGLLHEPALRARPAAVRARRRGGALGGRRHACGHRRLRQAGRAGGGDRRVRERGACADRAAGALGRCRARVARAGRRAVRPRAGPQLAADLLQRPDRRRLRGAPARGRGGGR